MHYIIEPYFLKKKLVRQGNSIYLCAGSGRLLLEEKVNKKKEVKLPVVDLLERKSINVQLRIGFLQRTHRL